MAADGVQIPADGAISEQVHEVLAQPRYANFLFDPNTWLSSALGWIGESFDWIVRLHGEHPLQYWLLFAAMLLVVIALIAHMVYTLRLSLRASQSSPSKVDESAFGTDFVGQARSLAGGEAFLEAAHHMLLASLRELASARHIELSADDTNAAVCARVQDCELPASLRSDLIELIGKTEREWFGERRADAILYERWCTTFENLQAQPTAAGDAHP